MRLESASLAARLARAGVLTTEQVEAARQYAAERRISLEDAFLDLKMTDYACLGRCLSDQYELPYTPLLTHAPTGLAATMISPKAAAHWKIFPVAYDVGLNLLTAAVSEPADMAKLDRIRRLLLQDYSLAFTVAAQPEIERALELHLGVDLKAPNRQKQKFPDLEKVREESRQRRQRGLKSHGSADSDALPYEDVSGGLLRLAALSAELHLVGNPDRLREIQARVRYCGLMAARLDLNRAESDRIALAAWLSAFEERPDLLRSVEGLCDLREVLHADGAAVEGQRTEIRILRLVKEYVLFRERKPSAARDANAVRIQLRTAWSSAPALQPTLETFLQVLMDETYLNKSGASNGRIMVIGSGISKMAGLGLVLRREDFHIDVAEDEGAAWLQMGRALPDLIVASSEALALDGEDFCRRLRADRSARQIPLILVEPLGGEAGAARHLRAGASDVLIRPVDPELLLAKVQKLLRAQKAPGTGVSGALEDMSFTDLIQVLCAGGRTAEIVLAEGEKEGRVFIQNGEVVHASAGPSSGEQAFYELMKWKRGTFLSLRCEGLPERTIHVSVMSLLMEGARQVDEGEPAADGAL